MGDSKDWRLSEQNEFLRNSSLYHREYVPSESSDHEHCEFCGAKISNHEGDISEGYTTTDLYHWICPTCFQDFKAEFGWKVLDTPTK